VALGQEAVAGICKAIEAWAAQVGKPKRTTELVVPMEDLDDHIRVRNRKKNIE
jgi:hypothetical protein